MQPATLDPAVSEALAWYVRADLSAEDDAKDDALDALIALGCRVVYLRGGRWKIADRRGVIVYAPPGASDVVAAVAPATADGPD